jgi:hypothetical protein
MAGDANHRDWIPGNDDPKLFTDGIVAGKSLLRHHIVNDCDGLRIDMVLIAPQ